MAESFSREKLRHAPQNEGGGEILCDLPPVRPRLVRPTNFMSRINDGKNRQKQLEAKSRKSGSKNSVPGRFDIPPSDSTTIVVYQKV